MKGAPDDLVSLQRFMANAVRRTVALPKDAETAHRATELFPSGLALSPAEQLEVYRDGFWVRHIESLEEDYPTLVGLLGKVGFTKLATEYLGTHPPSAWDLRRLGEKLPGFLEARDESLVIRDGAKLDWAFMEAFDAAESNPFDPSSLANASEDDWPAARVLFHASLRALSLEYPLHDYRLAKRRGEEPESPDVRASSVVVHRFRGLIHAVEVEAIALDLVRRLQSGAPLAPACEEAALAHGIEDAATLGPRVGGWFQEWTTRGWVSEVRL